jgi:tripartite-type tricarboxylate transporter receptor subunit TctC
MRMTPAEFDAYIEQEKRTIAVVAKAAGIAPN